MVTLEKYLKIFRIDDWFLSGMLIPLVGTFVAGGGIYHFTLAAIIFFCVGSYGFLINDYFDEKLDRYHKKKMLNKKNSIASGKLSKLSAQKIALLLIIIAISISLVIGKLEFLTVLACILSLTIYSVRGIRFKEKIGLDFLTHGLAYLFSFLGGYFIVSSILSPGAIYMTIMIFILGQSYLVVHQIRDYEEDSSTLKTTISRIGLHRGWILLNGYALTIAIFNEILIWCLNLNPILHITSLAYLIFFIAYLQFDTGNINKRNWVIENIFCKLSNLIIISALL